MRERRMSLAELLALGLGAQDAVDESTVGGEGQDGPDAAIAVAACDFIEDYLHNTLIDAHPQMDAMQKIRALFPNAMTLDYDNAAILEARGQARTAVDPDKLDTVQLFARFYEEQTGEPMDEEQRSFVQAAVRAVEGGADR